MSPSFTFPPITLAADRAGGGFARADIVFDGVEQAGPSFTGHVFLDNPAADATTPRTPDHGYAGAFHVFGYDLPPDPPDPPEPDGPATTDTADTPITPAAAERPAVPGPSAAVRAPITKSVMATQALARALGSGGEAVTVTVVRVGQGGGSGAGPAAERVRMVFDGAGP